MSKKILINDQGKLARQEKQHQTRAALNGKLVADLKASELAALVEHLADRLNLLDDQNHIDIRNPHA